MGVRVTSYCIVDVSGALRARQAERLARFGAQVQWLDHLPEQMHGVVLSNEVLDAMPVQLLQFDGRTWHECGVVVKTRAKAAKADTANSTATPTATASSFEWADSPTALRPPVPNALVLPGTVTEIHPRPRPSFAPWPTGCSAALSSSSTTASPKPSATTRSAAAAR